MAGHSKYKNTIHRKKTQDQKKAKVFTRIIKEIIIATKSGISNPNLNPQLRSAIISAKQFNLPKHKIYNAIKKATLKNSKINYNQIRYEGYGPEGVAIIIDALTNNKNRTTSEIKTTFVKNAGILADKGSVEYMFKKVTSIIYKQKNVNKNKLIDFAMKLKATDCICKTQTIEIILNIEKHSEINYKLEKKFGKATISEIKWFSDITVKLNQKRNKQILKLLYALNSLEDVLLVNTNHKVYN